MPDTWKASLNRLLTGPANRLGGSPRVAVLGVGNPLRSDDAAGVLVARALLLRECANETDRVLIAEAGPAPENRTGELRRFTPDLVLLVDGADMGETPGTVQWIAEESIDGMSVSTHSLPLSMLAHFLRLDLNCSVIFLGVQISSNQVGEQVSPTVLKAVDEIVDELDRALSIPGD